ncbi:MAG TPA: DUF2254 domain-containing protein [Burkholderiales bacterium]|nr:DUF2254 domain-containing protein [Burkholderiales bacterium]
MMQWNRWYSLKSYLSSALWVVPFFALVVGVVIKRAAERLGSWMLSQKFYDLETGFLGLDREEAVAVLDRIFTLNLSFMVFTFGSLLVAIQVAGGQYTPRIIATTLLRDNVIRWIVGFFVFSMLWANRTMVVMTASVVPQFQLFLSMVFGMASIVLFLLLIDYSAKLLRPVSLVTRIGKDAVNVVKDVYPNVIRTADVPLQQAPKHKWSLLPWEARTMTPTAPTGKKLGAPARTVLHQDSSGIVLAVNIPALLTEARRADCIVEIAPQVGDFVAVDEPLFYLYGNAGAIDDRRLRSLIAFGSERTLEQDPLFGFRILVDIALKALSPAINDPTTAVLAIDQLHVLLRVVGLRSLRPDEFADDSGQLRLIFRTPNWEHFVHISLREIRQCGAGSLQVVRRLRAMIENLQQTLGEPRRPALQVELDLLNRAAAQHFTFSEDLALACVPDAQGLGGSPRAA